MKKFIIAIVYFTIVFSIKAQNQEKSNVKQEKTTSNIFDKTVIVLVNDTIIGNMSIIKNNSNNSFQINHFSENNLSSKKIFSTEWKRHKMLRPELEISGIVQLEEKVQFKYKTQKKLNTFFGLNPLNNIYVNGYLLDKKHTIITECIKEVQLISEEKLTKEYAVFSKNKVLNIVL